MIALAAVIGAATAIGIGVEHRLGRVAELLSHRLMLVVLWVLMPIVAFFNIASLHLTARVGAGVGFAWVATLAAIALAYLLGKRVLRLPRASLGTLMTVSAFGNTGYLGLPFAAAALGFGQVPNAVAYDSLVSSLGLVTVGFSIGAAFGTVAERPRDRLRAFVTRNPPLWATLLGLAAPAALAPHWAVDMSRVLVVSILPIGFFAVGVTLSAEAQSTGARFPPPITPAVATAVLLKLAVPAAVVLALSSVVLKVPSAYVLQAAMAAGINNLVVANAYGLDRALAAAAIGWTTIVVIGAGVATLLV